MNFTSIEADTTDIPDLTTAIEKVDNMETFEHETTTEKVLEIDVKLPTTENVNEITTLSGVTRRDNTKKHDNDGDVTTSFSLETTNVKDEFKEETTIPADINMVEDVNTSEQEPESANNMETITHITTAEAKHLSESTLLGVEASTLNQEEVTVEDSVGVTRYGDKIEKEDMEEEIVKNIEEAILQEEFAEVEHISDEVNKAITIIFYDLVI